MLRYFLLVFLTLFLSCPSFAVNTVETTVKPTVNKQETRRKIKQKLFKKFTFKKKAHSQQAPERPPKWRFFAGLFGIFFGFVILIIGIDLSLVLIVIAGLITLLFGVVAYGIERQQKKALKAYNKKEGRIPEGRHPAVKWLLRTLLIWGIGAAIGIIAVAMLNSIIALLAAFIFLLGGLTLPMSVVALAKRRYELYYND